MKALAFAVLGSIILSSCGTTMVTLSHEVPGASITANGKYIGSQRGSITRTGFYQKTRLKVNDAQGNQIADQVIRRKITSGTIIWGVLTIGSYAGIGFFLFDWKYDRDVRIYLGQYDEPARPVEPVKSPWDRDPPKSTWD